MTQLRRMRRELTEKPVSNLYRCRMQCKEPQPGRLHLDQDHPGEVFTGDQSDRECGFMHLAKVRAAG